MMIKTSACRLSPIVLFVYNRPEHTRKTIEALASNLFAEQSELFIYSDAAKDFSASDKVNEVSSFIKTIQGFKSVTIIEREKNWGLAASIIDGVTNIVNQYEKVIVLEDDIVTSPYFLRFMNDALDFYADNQKVWHISGWNYPIDTKGLGDAFFSRLMNCWGWATWKDRWRYFEKDADKVMENFTKPDIYRFNINGAENVWEQVLGNKTGKINTWAVFWYAAIFQNKGLCLNPSMSFVENIGHDGTGEHCGKTAVYSYKMLSQKENIDLSKIVIAEDSIALKRVIRFYKKQRNIFSRIIKKLSKILKNVLKVSCI